MDMYTINDLRAEINWLNHAQAIALLESKGIKPAMQRKSGKFTYRLYDEAALTKCKELRQARDREMGLTKAPAPVVPAQPELRDELRQVRDELAAVRKQVDFLVQELTGMNGVRFDDASHGGTV